MSTEQQQQQQQQPQKDEDGGAAAAEAPVQAWALSVARWAPEDAVRAKLEEGLQPEEKERVRKFRFEVDRNRALAGRVMTREMAAKMLSVAPAMIVLQRTEMGKPFVAQPDPGSFSFNLSHHGDWVVLMAHPSRCVGVDIMKYEDPKGSRSIEDFFTTMRSSFTPGEWERIRLGDKDDALGSAHLQRFYKYWSLKEAYLKAIGIGIGFGLQRASFFLDETSGLAKLDLDGVRDTKFTFRLSELDSEHCVAVAIETSPKDADSGPSVVWTRMNAIETNDEGRAILVPSKEAPS
ncbi:L-aminoadipate-semialdehyde dehydrogenase-phosphopantetheinyl transferase [Hondaea fermentalgiana]|uniref:holo-[acyl-carrier-protein] synthase n=1 Tax=Hondaea fermentalgiana TaxID=2315210 RepID=A0A2R5GJL9_9STRA|nr:L-aminoadipate-semialdehyde dehydrogenase-phosphopantetheinyl transferase [Hondaea fermentalgiana]|eukprot:GBG31077.1 L-aminoadipate-semialdehyde dehydrogenase-phosphopantetheinyl transferase [Hondaea fermentalgiana]